MADGLPVGNDQLAKGSVDDRWSAACGPVAAALSNKPLKLTTRRRDIGVTSPDRLGGGLAA